MRVKGPDELHQRFYLVPGNLEETPDTCFIIACQQVEMLVQQLAGLGFQGRIRGQLLQL